MSEPVSLDGLIARTDDVDALREDLEDLKQTVAFSDARDLTLRDEYDVTRSDYNATRVDVQDLQVVYGNVLASIQDLQPSVGADLARHLPTDWATNDAARHTALHEWAAEARLLERAIGIPEEIIFDPTDPDGPVDLTGVKVFDPRGMTLRSSVSSFAGTMTLMRTGTLDNHPTVGGTGVLGYHALDTGQDVPPDTMVVRSAALFTAFSGNPLLAPGCIVQIIRTDHQAGGSILGEMRRVSYLRAADNAIFLEKCLMFRGAYTHDGTEIVSPGYPANVSFIGVVPMTEFTMLSPIRFVYDRTPDDPQFIGEDKIVPRGMTVLCVRDGKIMWDGRGCTGQDVSVHQCYGLDATFIASAGASNSADDGTRIVFNGGAENRVYCVGGGRHAAAGGGGGTQRCGWAEYEVGGALQQQDQNGIVDAHGGVMRLKITPGTSIDGGFIQVPAAATLDLSTNPFQAGLGGWGAGISSGAYILDVPDLTVRGNLNAIKVRGGADTTYIHRVNIGRLTLDDVRYGFYMGDGDDIYVQTLSVDTITGHLRSIQDAATKEWTPGYAVFLAGDGTGTNAVRYFEGAKKIDVTGGGIMRMSHLVSVPADFTLRLGNVSASSRKTSYLLSANQTGTNNVEDRLIALWLYNANLKRIIVQRFEVRNFEEAIYFRNPTNYQATPTLEVTFERVLLEQNWRHSYFELNGMLKSFSLGPGTVDAPVEGVANNGYFYWKPNVVEGAESLYLDPHLRFLGSGPTLLLGPTGTTGGRTRMAYGHPQQLPSTLTWISADITKLVWVQQGSFYRPTRIVLLTTPDVHADPTGFLAGLANGHKVYVNELDEWTKVGGTWTDT